MTNEQQAGLDTELTLEQMKEFLLEQGKKNRSLTYKEIMDTLAPFDQEPEQINEFFELLVENGIDVANESQKVQPHDSDASAMDDLNIEDPLLLPSSFKIDDSV